MTANKDIASFFENGTTDQFEYCYKLYPQVLKIKAEKRSKKPQELIRLDQWYQNDLPKLIKGRGKDAHMVYDELVQTMKWKQSRGKFYPQLSYLVKVNTPRAVMQETKKAFRKLPNLEQAITALSNLKGVGTTMASALLAAAAPHSAPFMADECLMAIPEIEGIDYTTKEYLNFVQHIQATVERLNKEAGGDTPFWSPHRVELALWAHYVANDLSPELLDQMPAPGSGGANTNGSAAKVALDQAPKVHDGGDDTNDDDESLGAENDSTNPAPVLAAVTSGVLQDGDSNFVSNDSTSQEPIIDENTTQTTATTSTDEGEAGTPLASDSESNLEAPEKALKNNVAAVDPALVAASIQPNSNSSVNVNMNTNSSSEIGIGMGMGIGIGIAVGDNATDLDSSLNKSDVLTAIATTNAVGNGNGNGTLTTLVAGSDGENSSCLRSTGNDEASNDYEADANADADADADADVDDDENGGIADESSNSNSHIQCTKSVTPLLSSLNDVTNNTADSNNESTLSSTTGGNAAPQKRSLCAVDSTSVLEETNSQPELKKVRSD